MKLPRGFATPIPHPNGRVGSDPPPTPWTIDRITLKVQQIVILRLCRTFGPTGSMRTTRRCRLKDGDRHKGGGHFRGALIVLVLGGESHFLAATRARSVCRAFKAGR